MMFLRVDYDTLHLPSGPLSYLVPVIIPGPTGHGTRDVVLVRNGEHGPRWPDDPQLL